MSSDFTTSDAEAVYDACASIPAGMVITYGDLAELVGRPASHSRNVATILGKRPHADTDLDPLPWWRVVRSNGTLLDADLITGPRAQWVGRALDWLADEGVPLVGDGVHRRVDMARATRMPIPAGITPWVAAPRTTSGRSGGRSVREPEPCWRHEKVQYSCRDCAPSR
jgi:alkylated DNA nucleotide flippase Atl1